MARVRRVSIFRREIIESVSPAGFEVLLRGARRLSEGKVDDHGRFFGSTMLTFELEQMRHLLREGGDRVVARRLAGKLAHEPSLLAMVERLAIGEACRVAGGSLRDPVAEVRISSRGSQVLLDIDVEGLVQAGQQLVGR